MPTPNIIAGILIGVANETWLAVALTCVIWGFVVCALRAILNGRSRDQFILNLAAIRSQAESEGRPVGFSLRHPRICYYRIEYFTAVFTSGFYAIFTFTLKNLFLFP